MGGPNPSKRAFEFVVTMILGLIVGVSCTPATPESLPSTAIITPVPTRETPPPTALPTITPIKPTETSESQKLEIEVPSGDEPTIDGVLSPEEWAPAYQAELVGGGELLLMHGEGYLYLGVRAKPEPVTSICVNQGEQVSIFHSSAALGTATYQQGDEGWEKTRDFEWCCRETVDSPQAQENRAEQLQEDNWLASNGRMGAPEEIEFKIGMPNGLLRLGVTSIGAPDYEDIAWWPLDMAADCRNLSMIQGSPPDQAQFSVDNWMTLTAPTN
jgi:hypothetical protein